MKQALRRWFNRHLRRYDGELCQRCGGSYGQTTAGDDLWVFVVRGRFVLLCPACFDVLATEQGVALRWRPEVDYPFGGMTREQLGGMGLLPAEVG